MARALGHLLPLQFGHLLPLHVGHLLPVHWVNCCPCTLVTCRPFTWVTFCSGTLITRCPLTLVTCGSSTRPLVARALRSPAARELCTGCPCTWSACTLVTFCPLHWSPVPLHFGATATFFCRRTLEQRRMPLNGVLACGAHDFAHMAAVNVDGFLDGTNPQRAVAFRVRLTHTSGGSNRDAW